MMLKMRSKAKRIVQLLMIRWRSMSEESKLFGDVSAVRGDESLDQSCLNRQKLRASGPGLSQLYI